MKNSGIYLVLLALFVVVIILFSHLGGGHSGPGNSSRKRAFSDISGGLKMALKLFKDDCGRYPTTEEGFRVLTDLPTNDLAKGWRGPYLDLSAPRDPWGHEYIYRCPGIHNTNGYDLSSFGPDGVGNTADDIVNWMMPQAPR